MDNLLEQISDPGDIKGLKPEQLRQLADESRAYLIETISKTGGHLASNLGVVELTIALHYIFNSPEDKIIWDVGHQSYTHKLITGRRDRFDTLRKLDGISGFPKTQESEHDTFNTGHSSTSISAALGFAKARDLKKEDYSVISVIGDGALTGGMSFEALNDAGRSLNNLIVVLNDNEFSISKNVGGLSRHLSQIRAEPAYFKMKEVLEKAFSRIPGIGTILVKGLDRIKNSAKYLIMQRTLFEELGFSYFGPIDGHDINELIRIFSKARFIKGPVLIHVHTKKGRGYKPAEENPDAFHCVSAFEIQTGKIHNHKCDNYSDVFGKEMLKLAEEKNELIAITAAMRDGTGLVEFSKKYPKRFFDVGIAEQHAVTFAAGMAKGGLLPVFSVYSSFLQRAYDQIIHDVAMQNLHVVLAIDRAGVTGEDGETHQGIYDLSFLTHIPNMSILSPCDYTELKEMLRYAVLEHNGPIAIRYPKGNGAELLAQTQEPVRFHKGIRLCAGNDITIVAAGKMVETSLSIATALKSSGIYADVINARFIKPLDEELIIESIMRTKKAVTIEDNSIVSGLGSGILQMLNQHGLKTDIKIFGFPDRFIEQGKQNELLKRYSLDPDSLIREIKEFYGKTCRSQRMINRHKILVDVLTTSFLDVQEQLNYVLHQSLILTDSQYGYIYLYDEESDEFTLNSWTNGVMQDCAVTDRQTKYQLDKTGIWGEVVRQRKPIVVNDFMQANPLKKGYPEGHVQLQKFMSIPVIFDDKIVAVVGLANNALGYDDDDVTEMTLLMNNVWNAITRRQAQALLSFERNKYFQTLISIGDGVLVVDKNGVVEMLNKVAQKLTGWTQDEASGKHYKEVFILSNEIENHTINDPIADALETNEVQELENHAVLTSREGQKYNLEDSAAPILDDMGNTIGVVLIFRDVTEKKEQKREIEYLNCHDILTGLHNRRCFDNNRAKIDQPDNYPLSVIFADINGLKLTNDIFGHTAGDQLIMKAAEILQQVCRQFDVIARVGGDEFILLLPNTTQENAEKVIDRIRSGFADARVKAIKCSISLGLDTKSSPDQNLDEIISNAENAMYKDKSINRQTVNNGMIDTIIETLHSRSPIEKQHSLNVSHVCAKIGTAMNLSEADIGKLGRAGYLHDIGKIVLDDGLLSADFINEDELDVIRQHALVGYRILNLFDDTVDLAEYVYNHHERWDGTGYPRGLKGAQIPLASRIISIVEAYDRILNRGDKPVDKRKADAVETINKAAGTQFDPLLTKLLSEVIEE